MIVPDTKWHPELKSGGRSKYKALAQAIREGIVSRQLQAGERLPPVRELAFQVGVTPGTVARAYAVLIDEGRLTAGVGRGTFVADNGGVVPSPPDAPVMLDPSSRHAARAHLLSPKVPDVGQAQMMREGMALLASNASAEELLRYPTRDSDLAAREAFVKYTDDQIVGSHTAEDVVVAHGGQNAIVMILQTILHGASPVIAVDELSYGGFRSAAMMCRAQVVSIPWDEKGPSVQALELLIKQKSVQVFCTGSEVCNPTVKATAPERRVEIAELAKKYGVHVLDDQCYRLMRSQQIGPSYRALLPDLGWYVTSPSKTLSASLRIGFTIAPSAWSVALVRSATYNSFGVSRQVTDLYAYLMNHAALPTIIDRVRARISKDVRAAVNILGGHNLNWSDDVPFLWLELPRGWRASAFCAAAETTGVLIKPAEDFALRDGRLTHAVRVAVNGQIPHEDFVYAMQQLRTLLDQPAEQISI